MKIAILLSGTGQHTDTTIKSINDNLIRPWECDVFVHCSKCKYTDLLIKALDDEKIEPKALLVEKDIKHEFPAFCYHMLKKKRKDFKNKSCPYPERSMRQLHGLWRVYSLFGDYCAKTHEGYDCLVRCRMDMEIIRMPSLGELDVLNMAYMYIPEETMESLNRNWCYDRLAFGGEPTMRVYFERYKRVQKFTLEEGTESLTMGGYMQKKGIDVPEMELYYTLTKAGIEIRGTGITCNRKGQGW